MPCKPPQVETTTESPSHATERDAPTPDWNCRDRKVHPHIRFAARKRRRNHVPLAPPRGERAGVRGLPLTPRDKFPDTLFQSPRIVERTKNFTDLLQARNHARPHAHAWRRSSCRSAARFSSFPRSRVGTLFTPLRGAPKVNPKSDSEPIPPVTNSFEHHSLYALLHGNSNTIHAQVIHPAPRPPAGPIFKKTHPFPSTRVVTQSGPSPSRGQLAFPVARHSQSF